MTIHRGHVCCQNNRCTSYIEWVVKRPRSFSPHLFHYHDAMHDRVKKILKERQKEAEDSLVAHLQVCLPSAVQHIHGLCDFGNLPCRPGGSRYGKHHPFTPDTLPTPQAPHTPGERQEHTPNSCHVSKSNQREFLKTWGSDSGTPASPPTPHPGRPSMPPRGHPGGGCRTPCTPHTP
ncbi:uncharacterized protein LOC135096651 isoform X2 [Scylla paramamosain]|uniref:uncharacterized protein LOC135096651 isoform X2 n=2 Tax=Scylla paramamosain TaxID=85552 RepID=UPI003083506E